MKNLFGARRDWLKKIGELTRLRKPSEPKELECELFKLCKACGESASVREWQRQMNCCPCCGHHERISSLERIENLVDAGYEFIDSPAEFQNPLGFPGYEEKWRDAGKKSGADEAIRFVKAKIDGSSCILGAMEPSFLMASMGRIVGNRIVHAFELAEMKNLPVIIVACSGGARMQEGIFSLMQMRRTAAMVQKHREAGRLFISVLTDPTTGGVTASFASLGDIILAEPGSLIGFAGPRVIKETIQCDLPPGFQLAEFQQRHGFVDRLVERKDLRRELATLLRLHEKAPADDHSVGKNSIQIEKLSRTSPSVDKNSQQIEKVSPMERVRKARDTERIKPREILAQLCTDIVELSGDRCFGDDASIRGGLARLGGLPITYLYTEKGSELHEQIYHHFGMPHPEAYRKAARLMRQAEQFSRPILAIVDTPGAYPGVGAEERGQGEAIAANLALMSSLSVPMVTLITGEAGSGGALALACSDRLYMLENAVYSILSPEGFAVILWKDRQRAEEAAAAMKLTAEDMKKYGVCDEIFPDTLEGLREQLLLDFSRDDLKRQELFDLKNEPGVKA